MTINDTPAAPPEVDAIGSYGVLAKFKPALGSLLVLSVFRWVFVAAALLLIAEIALGGGALPAIWLAAASILCIVLSYAFRQVRARQINNVLRAADDKLSSAALDKLGVVRSRNAASFFTSVFGDLDVMRGALSSNYIASLLDLPMALMLFATTSILFGDFFFAPIIFAALFATLAFRTAYSLSTMDDREKLAILERNDKVLELAGEVATPKSLSISERVKTMWRDYQGAAASLGLARGGALDGYAAAAELLYLLGLATLAGLAAFGGIGAMALLGAFLLMSYSFLLIMDFIRLIPEYFKFVAAIERTAALIGAEVASGRTKFIESLTTGSLSLKSASFSDSRGAKILDRSDFIFESGSIYALSAKSSFESSLVLRLLSGNSESEDGQVLFDQYDLATISPASARAFIRYIPQGYFILDGTVRENLECMADEAFTDKKFHDHMSYKSASQLLGLDTEIAKLSAGYNTMISRDRPMLSEEALKLLSLARAFVGNPRLMLFDSPLSGLSSASRKRFATALDETKTDRIAIVSGEGRINTAHTEILIDGGRLTVGSAQISGDDTGLPGNRALFKRIFKK